MEIGLVIQQGTYDYSCSYHPLDNRNNHCRFHDLRTVSRFGCVKIRCKIPNQKVAGTILFAGTFSFIIALQVAEFLDGASYNVSSNEISDLGTYCNSANICVNLPSHNLFHIAVFLVGIAIVIGSYFLYRAFKKSYSARCSSFPG
jgi:hypothetical protein